MPLRANVGISRKVGERNYGSRGASINLEVELDCNLIGDPDRLRARLQQLFALAKAAVNAELAPGHGARSEETGDQLATENPAREHASNGVRRATAAQVRAIRSLAARHALDLDDLLTTHYETPDPAELPIAVASEVIDYLKNITVPAEG